MSETNLLNIPFDKMDKSQSDKYYNMLISAINKLTNHENETWQKLQTKSNPNFVKEQESIKSEQKLNSLLDERDNLFREQSKEYDKNTSTKKSLLTLNNSSEYVKGLSNYVYHDTDTKLSNLNNDIMTLKRLSLNSQKNYSDLIERNRYLRYFCTILCILVIIFLLGAIKLINEYITFYSSGLLIILSLFFALIRYVVHLNDSKFFIRQKLFSTSFVDDPNVLEEPKRNENETIKCPNTFYFTN